MDYREFPFEIKTASDEEDGFVSGYASVFGGPPDLQGDIMVRGCFKDTIESTPGWPMLFGHSMSKCCGFWTKAVEDHRGLLMEGQLTMESPEGAAAAAIVRHGSKLKLPFGLSIGYAVNPQGYKVDGDVRKLTSVTLHEVSLVPIPACGRARVTRIKQGSDWTIRDLEQYLRDGGLSKEAAIAIAAGGFKALDRRDADEGKDDELRDAMALMSWVAKETFLLKER
jgi:HK97 family phage prohead protease